MQKEKEKIVLSIPSLLYQELSLLTIYDGIELFFFITVSYYFLWWISHDAYNNLSRYFYTYCIMLGISYATHLQTIAFFLTFFSPVFAVCFIVLHQKTLQKNFVALQNSSPVNYDSKNWIDHLIRICLYAMNNKKSLTVIIEQNDSLNTMLNDNCYVSAPITSGIIELLIDAPSFKIESTLWITKSGMLKSIDAQWKEIAHTAVLSPDIEKMPHKKQCALTCTTQTDALIVHADSKTHTFTLYAHSTLFESLTSQTVLKTLTMYLNNKMTPHKKGIVYGAQSKETSTEHPAP